MNSIPAKAKKVSVVTAAEIQAEIRHFDTVLDNIQSFYPEDVDMWDYINQARDAIFRVQQKLRGVNTMDYSSMSEDSLLAMEETLE